MTNQPTKTSGSPGSPGESKLTPAPSSSLPGSGFSAELSNSTKTNRLSWRCHICGQTFAAWAPAERHADATGHPRLELVL